MAVRSFLYQAGLFKTRYLDVPVISVGNITMGGTGKTPMVETLIRIIQKLSLKLVVLSRGYKGTYRGDNQIVSDGEKIFLSPRESGDEPYLLAMKNRCVPVIVGKNRYKAGKRAVEKFSPNLLILDDGFQHLALGRNINILLINAQDPFGGGVVCPAGMLREPLSAIRRADAIIVTKGGKLSQEEYCIITRYSRAPIFFCHYTVAGINHLTTEESKPISFLENKKIGAFAGLANPNSFFSMLEKNGVKLAGFVSYRDHCDYTKEMVFKIAEALSICEVLVTTEKDAVKLQNIYRENKKLIPFSKPVYVVKIVHQFLEPDRFSNFIKRSILELLD